MAAPRQALVLLQLQSSKLILNSYLKRQNASVEEKDVIQIPKRKKRDPTSVLRALSKTVKRDPTAAPYMFHDDPFLLPRNAGEGRRYLLAAESGRKAAQYVIKKWPETFLAIQRDAPKVEAFYPPQTQYVHSEPSEEAILERVDHSDMKDALDMYYKLLESGSSVSVETSNALLDLLCYHGYSPEPPPSAEKTEEKPEASPPSAEKTEEKPEALEEKSETPETDDQSKDNRGQRSRGRKTGSEVRWKDDNEMEKLFAVMPDRNAHSYCSMVRGMIKHGATSKAFIMYNEMQERGIQTDVHAYNALIGGAVYIRNDYDERWKVMQQLLKQMQLEEVKPNLHTFNKMLDALRIMGIIGRKKALQVISEMKAVGVEPSLGTYNLLLMIYYKDFLPPSDILYDIVDTIEGTSFSLRHEQDVYFFKNAMNICLSLKDIELAYRVDMLLNTGENYKLVGDYFSQNVYYGKFFHLICLMDSVEAMLDYYEKLVPSALIPSVQVYAELLRSMETAGTYDKIGLVWRDIRHFSYHYQQMLLETLLSVMAQANDIDAKIATEFFHIAMEIRKVTEASKSRRDPVEWQQSSLTHLALVCLKAKRLDEAWDVLELFKQEKNVPSNVLLEEYLEACIASADNQKAIGFLQLVSTISSTITLHFADRIKESLTLTPKERKAVDGLVSEDDLELGGSRQ